MHFSARQDTLAYFLIADIETTVPIDIDHISSVGFIAEHAGSAMEPPAAISKENLNASLDHICDSSLPIW